jgi:hypothetical protein
MSQKIGFFLSDFFGALLYYRLSSVLNNVSSTRGEQIVA